MATATAIPRNMNQNRPPDVKPIPAARKAEKRQVKLKLAIQGPSGSCKTKGSLYLATNLWPGAKILLVDTENESASLYADEFEFDTIPLDPPFESIRYETCIDYAVQSGYDVLILDSISHQWDGEGGILRRKEELDRRPGSNSFTNWATFTPEHTRFIEAIKQAPIHIIATMRSKQEYALEQNDKGKTKPVKMGMAPIQRDGFDYEFTIVFDAQMDHRCQVSKDRTSLFGEKLIDLKDKKIATLIKDWLESGKPSGSQTAPSVVPPPKPQPQSVHTNDHAQAQKVEGFTLNGDVLTCHVYHAEKRKAKNGNPYVAIKHNAEVNGKDIAFCFHEKLWDLLLTTPGKQCRFYLGLGNFVAIEDVQSIGEQEYREGQPITESQPNVHGVSIADDDIPF